MLDLYSKTIDLYLKLIYRVIILFMFILIIAVGLQVAGRYVFFIPRYLWTIELSNFCLVWLIFLGSIVGVKERRHFYMNIFYKLELSPKFEGFLDIVYYFVLISISLVFVFFGYRFFQIGCLQTSELTGLNLGIVYISVPLTGVSWLLVLIEEILKRGYH